MKPCQWCGVRVPNDEKCPRPPVACQHDRSAVLGPPAGVSMLQRRVHEALADLIRRGLA